MAFPATIKTLQSWVMDVDRMAANLQLAAQQQLTFSAAGNLDMDMVRRFFDQLVQANNFFVAVAKVTAFPAYLKTEKQDSGVDPNAEFAILESTVVATLDWLRANIVSGKVGGQDYKVAFLFPADNVTPSVALKLSADETVSYRDVLSALIATVN